MRHPCEFLLVLCMTTTSPGKGMRLPHSAHNWRVARMRRNANAHEDGHRASLVGHGLALRPRREAAIDREGKSFGESLRKRGRNAATSLLNVAASPSGAAFGRNTIVNK